MSIPTWVIDTYGSYIDVTHAHAGGDDMTDA